MDWLMGKARGVSKGLVNTNSSTLPVVSDSVVQSSPTSPGTVAILSGNVEGDVKGVSPTSCEPFIPNGSRSVSPVCSPTAPAFVSTSATSSGSIFGQRSLILGKGPSSSKSAPTSPETGASDCPLFMQEKYVMQQLTGSNPSKYVDFRDLVEPFPAMDQNEWLAAHTIALFDNMSTVFDAVHELCTCSQLLPDTMSFVSASVWSNAIDSNSVASPDEDKSKKSKHSGTVVNNSPGPARQQIHSALSSCQELIQSARIFPVRQGEPFPPDLPNYVTLICKNLLLCIMHLYFAHFHHLEQLELVSHLNTLARHFFEFTTRFSLVEDRHLGPLSSFYRVLLDSNPTLIQAPVTPASNST
ncbi:hypothetical protein T265_15518 [Opisthorchis viverrini]|uniref:Mob1/phocein family protein n=1 Tax=Opisthorchis viverrini TaxID=6198 RepID=A0A074ZWD9_OPIVI|nr:hypothetical protein T265_15518 [Opisthorchis viverrini]KER19519.1 hypothetical protein T265_15518 [Opisthorchis viverrini]